MHGLDDTTDGGDSYDDWGDAPDWREDGDD